MIGPEFARRLAPYARTITYLYGSTEAVCISVTPPGASVAARGVAGRREPRHLLRVQQHEIAGQQHREGLPEHLARRVPEDLLRSLVEQRDRAAAAPASGTRMCGSARSRQGRAAPHRGRQEAALALSLRRPRPRLRDLPRDQGQRAALVIDDADELTPELAETIAQYERVCFVDAHTGAVPHDVNVSAIAAECIVS